MATVGATSRSDLAPIRRISCKGSDNRKAVSVEFSEKHDIQYTTSETTAHELHNTIPNSLDLPTRPSISTLCNTDMEGQHDQEFPFGMRSLRRTKFIKCVVIFVVLIAWILLLMGVLILTDTLFPTAVRSYHKLKGLRAQLSEANFELEGLKVQMSMLKQSIGRMGSMTIQKFQRQR